jgi:glycosyl hydrolase family 114
MRARLGMCAAKGFDAVEFDNVDAYLNRTGFALCVRPPALPRPGADVADHPPARERRVQVGDELLARLEAVDVVDLHWEERRLGDAAQAPLPARAQAGVPAAGAVDRRGQCRGGERSARKRTRGRRDGTEQDGDAEDQQ